VADTTEAAWAAALEDLERRHEELLRVVGSLEASRLEESVPGMDHPVVVMLHGTAQHYAYHAGQIALLKRLVG
jgi:hypothetical protein